MFCSRGYLWDIRDSLPEKLNIIVTNPLIFNKPVSEVARILSEVVVISGILHKGNLNTASSENVIHEGDIIPVVTRKGMAREVLQLTASM
ncbi:MAG: hypothetical protein WAW07_14355 [Bacteroidales bacterium]